MKTFIFATCEKVPQGSADDRFLVDELERRGHGVRYKIWNRNYVDTPDVTLIRSTWDYQRHFDEFMTWAARVKNLVNKAELVRTNATKHYLEALPNAVETAFATDRKTAFGQITKLLSHSDAIVLKPLISASAEFTFKVSTEVEAREAAESILDERGEVLIQPYIKSIATDGELSFIFFGTEFSHAVLKVPKSGDFRVQVEFGGSALPFRPTPPQIAFARGVLPFEADYARIDVVDWNTPAPKIGEIELIEPDLFFRTNSDAASKFTDYLLQKLHRPRRA